MGYSPARLKAPAAARFLRCLCRCSLPASVARLTLLRAWRKDGEGYALATRSVRHADAGTADAEVLPACWRLMPCEAGVALSYAVEFEVRDAAGQRAGALGRAPAPGHWRARRRRGGRRLAGFEFREITFTLGGLAISKAISSWLVIGLRLGLGFA